MIRDLLLKDISGGKIYVIVVWIGFIMIGGGFIFTIITALFQEAPDANIGAGLISFLGVCIVCLASLYAVIHMAIRKNQSKK